MPELLTFTASTLLIPGAAYIRYSSEMQNNSFSLDAQLRQIKDQADRDGAEIVSVFSDPATSAYYKRYRPGINAMRQAAHRGEFKILYVHKVDRLARRLEWCLTIVHELQALDITFKAVQQPFDLGTPEGKLLFHLVSSLGEFYSDNLSKETHKGKLERSLQGYHNGAVPWGYVSRRVGQRMTGVPEPDKGPVVVEMFELYASGLYSDYQIANWLNEQGHRTSRENPFGKDTVRDMLCNPYYTGKIRYRGMSVRQKGVSYRCTKPKIIEGQHEPIVSEELWLRSQRVRAGRRRKLKTRQNTVRIHLLQGIIVCAHCGRRMRAQTPNRKDSYYREESHYKGYKDCPFYGKSVKADAIDRQVAGLIQSLRLPEDWEEGVRQLLDESESGPDPEAQRREIRATLRLMRENYERRMYEGEEHVYWQKVNALQEELELLHRVPQNAIHRAAQTLLDLRESWDGATRKERRELVRLMIQEVACDIKTRNILWLKVRPDFEVLFQILEELRFDDERRFWIIPKLCAE